MVEPVAWNQGGVINNFLVIFLESGKARKWIFFIGILLEVGGEVVGGHQ